MVKSIKINLLEINNLWPFPEGVHAPEYYIDIREIAEFKIDLIGYGEKAVHGTLITLKSGNTIGVSNSYQEIEKLINE